MSRCTPATLPADGDAPAITGEPVGIRRFNAARVAWVGGSNWFDLPDVHVSAATATRGWDPTATSTER